MTITTVRPLYAAGLDRVAIAQLIAIDDDAAAAAAAAAAAQADADTAQTTADNSGTYAIANPGSVVWNSDSSSVAPADDTEDIAVTFYSKAQASIAVKTMRGTFTQSSKTIAVTDVSNSGLVTAKTLVDDGTASVRAEVSVTFADGSKTVQTISWSYVDVGAAGISPVTGGGK